jgi:hypothetical protein
MYNLSLHVRGGDILRTVLLNICVAGLKMIHDIVSKDYITSFRETFATQNKYIYICFTNIMIRLSES